MSPAACSSRSSCGGWANIRCAKVVVGGVLVPLVLFVVFEIWFLVPLPKGPVEALLGF